MGGGISGRFVCAARKRGDGIGRAGIGKGGKVMLVADGAGLSIGLLCEKRFETAFGELVELFPKKIYAVTLKGFLLKIQLFLFAFQIDKAILNN